jgi:hypothetical protein
MITPAGEASIVQVPQAAWKPGIGRRHSPAQPGQPEPARTQAPRVLSDAAHRRQQTHTRPETRYAHNQ